MRANEHHSEHVALTFVRLATTYAAVIAALGYMSLRAFMSYLGISAMQLTFERFLMETYTLVVETLVHLFVIAFVVFVLTLILWPVFRALRRRSSKAVDVRQWLAKPLASVIITIVAFASAGVLLLSAFHGRDVIVGNLAENYEALATRSLWPYDFALIVVAGGILLWRAAASLERSDLVRWIWRLSIVPWLTVAVLAPLLYGAAVRPALFPRCEVVLTDTPPTTICGLLIDSTKERALVWHVTDRVGRLDWFAMNDISRITISRSLDVIEEAKSAARTRPGQSSVCNCGVTPDRPKAGSSNR